MGPKPRNPDVLANAVSHLLIVGKNAEYTLHSAVGATLNGSEKPHNGTARAGHHAPRLLDVAKGSVLQGNLAKVALTCDNMT
ncbi:hypothetical protein [Rhodoferax sp. GW822-FHT02A01]|uniref:hypothetical protein n=1 Tax=Rhodoferax sp. GW822-FHT02A01 TaxID=3141537 RepID=UPI00315CFE74